jgi:hypothetical protein
MGISEKDNGPIGILIDYRVEDRQEVWTHYSLKGRRPMKEMLATLPLE